MIFASELAIGGIHLGDSKKSVVEKYGEPSGADDPTKIKMPSATYAGLTIVFNEGGNTAGALVSTSPKYCTPSNVCPGMPFSKAKAAYSKIHIQNRLSDERFSAYFGSSQACRLTFEVDHDLIKSLGASCLPW
ncbi:MAG: hypothetical protein J0I77_02715 [Rudaea sp.]|uniref:hypothetical protein n=1 Tax=unclassified Rudaea TaxID=2627037 RepID=UPI00148595A5|nr:MULTISPECIES: hypothetical protein [unclassified Rudaea]MBN8884611.1 hypothetical protein [Rudaea sp.]